MERQPTPERFTRIARRLKAMADPTRLHLLHLLADGELCVGDLAARVGGTQANVSKQAMSKLVASFVELGFLEWLDHPDDGRSRIVGITAAGRRLLATAVEALRRTEADYAALVGAEDLERLRALLARMRDAGRALRNLLDNAIAVSAPGSAVRLHAVTGARPGMIELAVEDVGPGVPPEDRPRIFSPFFRGTSATNGERPGAGLGLAIARQIARNGGGDVLLDETHRPGARFVLVVPAG